MGAWLKCQPRKVQKARNNHKDGGTFSGRTNILTTTTESEEDTV